MKSLHPGYFNSNYLNCNVCTLVEQVIKRPLTGWFSGNDIISNLSVWILHQFCSSGMSVVISARDTVVHCAEKMWLCRTRKSAQLRMWCAGDSVTLLESARRDVFTLCSHVHEFAFNIVFAPLKLHLADVPTMTVRVSSCFCNVDTNCAFYLQNPRRNPCSYVHRGVVCFLWSINQLFVIPSLMRLCKVNYAVVTHFHKHREMKEYSEYSALS